GKGAARGRLIHTQCAVAELHDSDTGRSRIRSGCITDGARLTTELRGHRQPRGETHGIRGASGSSRGESHRTVRHSSHRYVHTGEGESEIAGNGALVDGISFARDRE